MNSRDVEALLYERISPVISFSVKREGLVRNISGGKQTLIAPIIDLAPEFIVTLTACIRLDAVEAIFHRFSGSPAKYHSMSYTTMTQLEFFTKIVPSEYVVMSGDEVLAMVDDLGNILRDKIVPFFDEFNNVSALNRALNVSINDKEVIDRRLRFDSTLSPSGPMHAIIVAYLAGDKMIPQKIDHYRREMQLAGDDSWEPFERLSEFLRSTSN